MSMIEKSKRIETLSGPIYTISHRQRAVRRVIEKMRQLTRGLDVNDLNTWIFIAIYLDIGLDGGEDWLSNFERLVRVDADDTWCIEYDSGASPYRQARVICHEIAHWFLIVSEAYWLCSETIVHYYDGSINDEHHNMACDIEDAIMMCPRKANLSSWQY